MKPEPQDLNDEHQPIKQPMKKPRGKTFGLIKQRSELSIVETAKRIYIKKANDFHLPID